MNTFSKESFRFRSLREQTFEPKAGPVVTISREYGCNGSMISMKLCQAINERKIDNKWNVVTNEILHITAKELGVEADSISHVFGADAKNGLKDWIASFTSKDYASDRKIKETIAKVVHNFAEKGNCILVGRASCVIAQSVINAFHIRLIAPLPWRVSSIQKRLALPYNDALNLIESIDNHRAKFRSFFTEKLPESSLYGIIYNCSKLTEDEIVSNIMNILEAKGIVPSINIV